MIFLFFKVFVCVCLCLAYRGLVYPATPGVRSGRERPLADVAAVLTYVPITIPFVGDKRRIKEGSGLA